MGDSLLPQLFAREKVSNLNPRPGTLQIFFGFRLLPLQQTGYSTIGIDSRAAGIELESTAEIGNGSFQISFHLPRYATWL